MLAAVRPSLGLGICDEQAQQGHCPHGGRLVGERNKQETRCLLGAVKEMSRVRREGKGESQCGQVVRAGLQGEDV